MGLTAKLLGLTVLLFIDDGVSQSDGKKGRASEWCCVISHNTIMAALMNHFFGGDLEGLFGVAPFEVLHQLLLGIFKYTHLGIIVQLLDYP